VFALPAVISFDPRMTPLGTYSPYCAFAQNVRSQPDTRHHLDTEYSVCSPYALYMRWIPLLIVLIALPISADTISGYLVGITDGDTLTLLVNRTQIKVRLTEIDTLEKGQDWGSRATQVFRYSDNLDVGLNTHNTRLLLPYHLRANVLRSTFAGNAWSRGCAESATH
jgi:hypothetical protein